MCVDGKKRKQWILTWEEPDSVNVGIVFVDALTGYSPSSNVSVKFKFDDGEYPVKIKTKNLYLVNLASHNQP